MTALMNVESPALVLATPAGGASGTNPSATDRSPVPMVSVSEGRPRRRLQTVDSPPLFDVPTQIDGDQIARVINSYLDGFVLPAQEATAFERILGAAFAQGVEYQRSLMGVA